MKSLSYIALALSVIALALGVYALAGGFSGAGTAVLGTSTGTAPTSTSSVGTLTPATSTSSERTITLVLDGVVVPLVVPDKAGVKVADLVLQAAHHTSFSGQPVFDGWFIKSITVTSTVGDKLASQVLPKLTTKVTDATTLKTYSDAAIAEYRNIVDVQAFNTRLEDAAKKLTTGVLAKASGKSVNFRKFYSDSTTLLTGVPVASADAVKFMLTVVTSNGGNCESTERCGSGTQGQGT